MFEQTTKINTILRLRSAIIIKIHRGTLSYRTHGIKLSNANTEFRSLYPTIARAPNISHTHNKSQITIYPTREPIKSPSIRPRLASYPLLSRPPCVWKIHKSQLRLSARYCVAQERKHTRERNKAPPPRPFLSVSYI